MNKIDDTLIWSIEPRTWKCCKCNWTNYDDTSFICGECRHSKCGSCIFQG